MIEHFVRPRLGYYWYLFESVALFFLAFFIAWVIFGLPDLRAAFVNAIWSEALVTIFATFVGATLAFFLESWRDRRAETQRNLAEGRMAFFKLTRMLNRLENVKRNYVDPVRESPARCLEIPSLLNLDRADPTINFDSLSFMFAAHANLLGEVSIAGDQYVSVIDLINERSRFLRAEVQSRLKAAEVPQEFEMTQRELEKILGPGNLQEVTNLTNQMVESIDRISVQILDVTNKFGLALKDYFPALGLRASLEIGGDQQAKGQDQA